MPIFNSEGSKNDGKIRLSKTTGEQMAEKSPVSGKTAKIIAGALVGTTVLVGGGIWVNNDYLAPARERARIEENAKLEKTKAAQEKARAEQQERQTSISDKHSVVHLDASTQLAVAYIDRDGKEVNAGADFALAVSLQGKGELNILVADGEFAGTRLRFVPVAGNDKSIATYEKLAKLEGPTNKFTLLPTSQRVETIVDLKGENKGLGVSLEDNTKNFFQKTLTRTVDGKTQTAVPFTVKGNPVAFGLFSVKIWNGDTYNVNLKTGDYTVRSTFAANANWQPSQPRQPLKVNGVLDMTGVKPVQTPAPKAP